MRTVSSMPRKKSWQGQRRHVSVLAEMALRQEKVSARLLQLRERQGLSQEDAARKVGITTRQWQRWETGESMPYPRNLDMVASRFGISISEFFDEETPATLEPDQLDRLEAKLDALLSHLQIELDDQAARDGFVQAIKGAAEIAEQDPAAPQAKPAAKRRKRAS